MQLTAAAGREPEAAAGGAPVARGVAGVSAAEVGGSRPIRRPRGTGGARRGAWRALLRPLALGAALVVLAPAAHAERGGPTVDTVLQAPSAKPDGPVGVEAAMRVNTYFDNDGNKIVTPLVAVTATLGDTGQVTLDAHASVDIMTCASIDVLSAATPHGYFREVRKETGGDASVKLGDWTLSGGAVYSKENDYSSISGNFGAAKELNQKNTTVAVGYSYTDSNVGRSHDPTFNKDLASHTVTATVTQVLSKSLVGQVSYFMGYLDGFQSSPYRHVRIATGITAPESAPNVRVRNAVALRVKAALAPDHFLSGDYRAYIDSWGLTSHTVEVGYTWQMLPWLAWRLRDRFYAQSSTDFYAWTYNVPRKYMSSDRESGAFWGDLVGLRASFQPDIGRTQKLTIDLKFDFMYQKFKDFTLLPERLMYVTELGATWAF